MWLRVAKGFRSSDDRPTAYARRVLINLSRDRSRSVRRRSREVGEQLPDVVWPHDQTDDRPYRDELLRAVRRLPERQRAVLVLRYFDDLSVNDVADALGCSTGTVESQSHKALTSWRAVLRPTREEGHVTT